MPTPELERRTDKPGRRKADNALFFSEARYRALFRDNPTMIFTVDADWTILSANPFGASRMGYATDELEGRSALELFHDDDRAAVADQLQSCLETPGQVHRWLFRKIRKDGGVLWVEETAQAVYDLNGALNVLIVCQDVTERRRAEQELEEQEALLSNVLETLPIGVWLVDAKGTILHGNQAGQRIWSGARYVGIEQYDEYKGWWSDTGKSIAPREWAAARAVIRGETSLDEEIDIESFDGTRKTILHSAVPLLDASRRITGAVIINQDITVRKKVEEALAEKRLLLEEANLSLEKRVAETVAESRKKDQILIQQGRQAAMGEMIANIAHQWRQPLNTLGLIVQELLMTYGSDRFNRGSLEAGVRRAMELILHMSRTIEDFRNYFKPEKEKTPFNVNQAVARTLSLVEPSLKNLDIHIEVAERDDVGLNGYENEYAQVLLNIILNCKDAFEERTIDKERIITIAVFKENGKSVVTVADNAGGIPEKVIDRIFDPYFSTKGPDKGTGIGLFMAKTIIEKNMGGRLTVRNTADGAEFRIEA